MDAQGTLTSPSSVDSLSCSGTREVQRPWQPLGAPGLREARTCFHGLSGLPQVGRAPPQGSCEQGLWPTELTSPGPPAPAPAPAPAGLLPELGSLSPGAQTPPLRGRHPSLDTQSCSRLRSPMEPRNHLPVGWQAVEGAAGGCTGGPEFRGGRGAGIPWEEDGVKGRSRGKTNTGKERK